MNPNGGDERPVNRQDLLRRIPKVDLLIDGELEDLLARYPRARVLKSLRQVLDQLRDELVRGNADENDLEVERIRERLDRKLELSSRPYYGRVINATGVILHTGLGRACLAPEAVAALNELAGTPQRVEIDLESGERGGRDRGCGDLITELTGAEAATVVNNNAAATLLILAALARGRRVLVSRGELVEIGGSYRVPDIMRESGARLVEVGTTNRTHPRDYANAIDEDAGMILKVHTSNYRVVGFTAEVSIAALVELGRAHSVPVVYDLGSGCLADLASAGDTGRFGEDPVRELLAAGVDLVCFSGDKLLGGPQAGIIAGRSEAVDACRRHPLFRAMRPGRLVYTALEATLRLYLGGDEHAIARIPTLRRLTRDAESLRADASRWATLMADVPGLRVEAVPCASQAGSGSMPTAELASWGLSVSPSWCSVDTLATDLRRGQPPILTRTRDDALVFDLRTLEESELVNIHERLASIAPPSTGAVAPNAGDPARTN
jgi:L-seryl-tRNA(Ser) seleniumtransferase